MLLWEADVQSILTHWQHYLHKDNQGEKINQHLDLQLLLNPSGPYKTCIQSPCQKYASPPRHTVACKNSDDKFSLGQEPSSVSTYQSCGQLALELVKLCITADLFSAFIKAAAHPLTMEQNHNFFFTL